MRLGSARDVRRQTERPRKARSLLTVTAACSGLAVLLGATSSLAAPTAPAGSAAKPTGPSRSSSQFTLRREEAGGTSATTARARARTGDCKGALGFFDTAIAATVEPTLRRDRGLCHEKLGNPYPAIDDFRAYLVARPEAPDADQIRDRLARLEASVGIGAVPGEGDKEAGSASDGESGFQASAEGSADAKGVKVAARSGGKAADEEPLGPRGDAEGEAKGYDFYREKERAQEVAQASPLRYGKGFILGAFLHVPRYFFSDSGTSDLAYGVGVALRYSTGPLVTILGEVGYAGIGEVGSQGAAGGPLLFAGVEFRLPISALASDQIVLGGGLDFERQMFSSINVGANFLGGRARAGYRHIFGPQFGIEVMADGGYGVLIPSGGDADSRGAGLIGGSLAFLVGF